MGLASCEAPLKHLGISKTAPDRVDQGFAVMRPGGAHERGFDME
jgi:hypothetical protein